MAKLPVRERIQRTTISQLAQRLNEGLRSIPANMAVTGGPVFLTSAVKAIMFSGVCRGGNDGVTPLGISQGGNNI